MHEGASVPEAIAASLCWLSRWNGGRVLATTIEGGNRAADQVGFWHPDKCRFCDTPLDELLRMADLSRCHPDDVKRWERLPRKARAAKVYEAQGEPWWEQMP